MDFTGLLLDFYWTFNILISFEYPLIICTSLNRRFSNTLEENQKKSRRSSLCRRSRRWDSNPRRCDCLSQPSSTQPTAPQEYSGGEADRVWSGAYHTIPPFFYFWVVPVRLGPPPLPALTPDRSPPRPPILARLDPRTSCLVRLGPQSWPALAPDRCPPWPTILARLDLLWASTQKFQAGIVQYNQFAVDAGTSDTKCRRSRRWDSNPRRCDCLSQPSSTQPTAPQEYSGGEADRVWSGAYHSWLVKAPRWIHSVLDVSDRQSWHCGCLVRLWNLHDVTNTSRSFPRSRLIKRPHPGFRSVNPALEVLRECHVPLSGIHRFESSPSGSCAI